MKKRITSLLLAAIMLLQVIIPQTIFAQEDKSLPRGKYVKIGTTTGADLHNGYKSIISSNYNNYLKNSDINKL